MKSDHARIEIVFRAVRRLEDQAYHQRPVATHSFIVLVNLDAFAYKMALFSSSSNWSLEVVTRTQGLHKETEQTVSASNKSFR